MKLTLCLQLAALAHLGLICAGALMPRVVGLREHLKSLPRFIHRLVWVYYAFIGFCLVGFGAITFAFANQLAAGTPLARGICAFLCGFWTIRLVVATFVFDLQPYLTSRWRRVGYHATNIVFATLPIIYGWAALTTGQP